jgi:ligand-binding SRPBCC domain-containing protein
MPVIKLETFINAPVELCFDLSRDVDVHMASTASTGERAVAGVTSGLLQLGDEVTWEATHLKIRQRLTSKITEMDCPRMFVDEMQRGAFKRLRHLHRFKSQDTGTLMYDELSFASPLGILGRITDALFLENYLRGFLVMHNDYIRQLAEARTHARAPRVTETITIS